MGVRITTSKVIFGGKVLIGTKYGGLVLDGINFFTYSKSIENMDYIDPFWADSISSYSQRDFHFFTDGTNWWLLRSGHTGTHGGILLHPVDTTTGLPKYNYLAIQKYMPNSPYRAMWIDPATGRGLMISEPDKNLAYFTLGKTIKGYNLDFNNMNIFHVTSALPIDDLPVRIEIDPTESFMYIFSRNTSTGIAKFSITSAHDTNPTLVTKTGTGITDPWYYFTKPDGTKLYVGYNLSALYTVTEFNVSTPYDYTSTLVSTATKRIAASAATDAFYIGLNGDKLVFTKRSDRRDVARTINTPWDLSTLSADTYEIVARSSTYSFTFSEIAYYNNSYYKLADTNQSVARYQFDDPSDLYSLHEVERNTLTVSPSANATITDMKISNDGQYLYILSYNKRSVFTYSFVSAGSVTDGLNFISAYPLPIPTTAEPVSINFNSTGDKMTLFFGIGTNYIYANHYSEYTLTTPWNLSTMTENVSAVNMNSFLSSQYVYDDRAFKYITFDHTGTHAYAFIEKNIVAIPMSAAGTFSPSIPVVASEYINVENLFKYISTTPIMTRVGSNTFLLSQGGTYDSIVMVHTPYGPDVAPRLERVAEFDYTPYSPDNIRIHLYMPDETGKTLYLFPFYSISNVLRLTTTQPYVFSAAVVTVSSLGTYDSLGVSATYIDMIDFSPDGQYFYIKGKEDSIDKIKQFQCATPWDITSLTFVAEVTANSSYGTYRISPTGNFIYWSFDSELRQFPMSVPWDITTIDFTTFVTASATTQYRYQFETQFEINPSATMFYFSYDSYTDDIIRVLRFREPDDMSSYEVVSLLNVDYPADTNDMGAIHIVRIGQNKGKRMYYGHPRLGRIYTYKLRIG